MAPPSIDVTSIQGWQTIEAHLPKDFEALAKEYGVLEVQHGEAKVTSARDLLRLVLLHVGADLALRQAVVLGAEGGVPRVSHVTLHKKMRLAAPYLRALVVRLTSNRAVEPERWAGYELVVVDGSSFGGPGAQGTDARLHLQLRLPDLEVLDAAMTDSKIGESFKRFTWREGQLALGDRGYANPPGIVSVVEQGAEVLVRVNRSALPMRTFGGEPIDVMNWLRSLRGYAAREREVVVRGRDRSAEVLGRLIGMRLRPAQAEKARARVRRELGSKATFVDLEAAHYIVLFTTVPSTRMSTDMCLDLYRLRWQVELAFKRWKSLCHFDRLPNYRDDTILSWLYGKLLLALLMHRMVLGASALFPPEPTPLESDPLALDAVEGRQHRLARDRGRPAAA